MEDWGKGMLQAGQDYEIIKSIDEELGMRELRAKVSGKAGTNSEILSVRFSIHRELCYHVKSVEVVRKYLDSGVLLEYVNDYFWTGDRCWTGDDYRRFHVLAACAMTLGCTIPDAVRSQLERMQNPQYLKAVGTHFPQSLLKGLAKVQMKKAIADYQDGVPYDFGNTTMLEASFARMFPGTTVEDFAHMKIVRITQKNGKEIPHITSAPSDEELGLQPIHPNHVCAACGATEKDDKGELLACGKCHDRKYCSKACQKKHWKMHKIICSRPADQMAAFMADIQPLDFPEPDKATMDAMFGGKKAVFME